MSPFKIVDFGAIYTHIYSLKFLSSLGNALGEEGLMPNISVLLIIILPLKSR